MQSLDLDDRIKALVDAAPPLTAAQRDRLRVLLADPACEVGEEAAS